MSRSITPLKIVTPTNKRFGSFLDADCYTLDVNGRSYSPQNVQESLTDRIEAMSRTTGSVYESKKFKVRTAANLSKTLKNWRNLPFQRIRNVEKAINHQKQVERLSRSEKSPTILPQFQTLTPLLSPRINQKPNTKKETMDLHKKVEALRVKQIQQLIKSSREQSLQRRNVIRFENRFSSFEASEIILLGLREREMGARDKEPGKVGKASVYSDVVKNRKRLSQKRYTKKKVTDHSLLGRINYLQQHQEVNFVLRNSLENRVKGSRSKEEEE